LASRHGGIEALALPRRTIGRGEEELCEALEGMRGKDRVGGRARPGNKEGKIR